MKEIKIDDIFFKEDIDYKGLEENIYTQFAKTMAKNVDIDLAKTPLVDILTGYTRYREAEQEKDKYKNVIDKIKELINHYAVEDEDYSKIYNQEEKDILELLEEVE